LLARLPKKTANDALRAKNLTARRQFDIAEREKRMHHHGKEEEDLLDLPCDWRFLPKPGLAD
jgi:hypothetical protein